MSLNAMTSMSKAIRAETQKHGATLREIPTPVLTDLVEITGAFWADMRDELARRAGHTSPPPPPSKPAKPTYVEKP